MSSYTEQIKEVFIQPIRSVLVIDDQFPTLDSLLNGDDLTSFSNTGQLKDLLEFCRDKSPQWLVDVHDGRGLDGKNEDLPFSSIRQCDWLILDYKLDGDHGDASKSIGIIRTLAESDNFNLVVVYTSQETGFVFEEIVVCLSKQLREQIQISKEEIDELNALLDECEDNDPDIRKDLANLITYRLCIAVIDNGISILNTKNAEVFSMFIRRIETSQFGTRELKEKLLKSLILDFLSSKPFCNGTTIDITKSAGSGGASKWILAENVFLTIVQKTVAASDLIDHLASALEGWQPSPNRLVFAKLRAELESSGLRYEKQIFQDNALQAFWLDSLLQKDSIERSHYIGALLDRQTEMLTDLLRAKVTDFTDRVLTAALVGADSTTVTKRFLNLDPSNSAVRTRGLIGHNTHVSTKPPGGKNLAPGHILKLESDPVEFWICLSAACDLEAGRRGSGRDFKKRIEPWMPFTAVKLDSIATSKALDFATRQWVLFLSIESVQKQFSFFPQGNPGNSPVWEEFMACNEGRLVSGSQLFVAQVSSHDGTDELPCYRKYSASVVAQVRSEYAAALSLRLGNHLSRIGLDYLGSDLTSE